MTALVSYHVSDEPIPVYSSLAEVFGSLEGSLAHAKRWNDLAEQFEQRFGRKPAYIARAPGRVNLIGEHIDYALFGVLPAAIDRDILIACAPRENLVAPPSPPAKSDRSDMAYTVAGSVVAENLHPRQEFSPTSEVTKTVEQDGHTQTWFLDIDTTVLRWESYIKAGYYGVLNRFFNYRIKSPVGVDLLVTGSVPAGSGLSSSAAMVVASTLAFVAVNGEIQNLTKGDLVQLAMLNEKRVGVNSGGMDQAASVMSNPSSALYITFFPSLAASPVRLPPRAVFVIANSLKVADKVLTASHGYNLRVVETLVAARVLANSLRVSVADERITLREVVDRQRRDGDDSEEELDRVLEFLLQSDALDVLKSEVNQPDEFGVTMDEMVEMSGLSKEMFDEVYLSWVDVESTHFQLYKRAKHVLSEGRRVLQFRKTCLDESNGVADGEVLYALGRLMNDSQESCSTLFECSCPELDELTGLARKAGALGSRLTGAGWGGCTVSLVPEDQVEGFIREVRETYGPYKDLDEEALNQAIFATKPGRGACVFEL